MKPNYIIIPLITILVATVGGWLTDTGMEWYETINLPSWTPAGSLIGTVWTILFILATISALIVWNHPSLKLRMAGRAERNKRFRWIVAIFLINAGLNVFWSFLFFNQHLIGAAIFEAALLALSVVALIVLIWSLEVARDKPILRLASMLLVPYAAWVSFAAYLTYSVWILN